MKKTGTFLLSGLILLLVETTWASFVRYDILRFQGIAVLLVWYGAQVHFLQGVTPVLALCVLASRFTIQPVWIIVADVFVGYVIVRYVVRNVMLGMTWQWMLLVFFVAFAMTVFLMTASGVPDLVWPWGILQAGLDAVVAPVMFSFFDRLDVALSRSAKDDT